MMLVEQVNFPCLRLKKYFYSILTLVMRFVVDLWILQIDVFLAFTYSPKFPQCTCTLPPLHPGKMLDINITNLDIFQPCITRVIFFLIHPTKHRCVSGFILLFILCFYPGSKDKCQTKQNKKQIKVRLLAGKI